MWMNILLLLTQQSQELHVDRTLMFMDEVLGMNTKDWMAVVVQGQQTGEWMDNPVCSESIVSVSVNTVFTKRIYFLNVTFCNIYN